MTDLCTKYATFVQYFETTYIGKRKRGRNGGREVPLFAPLIWNVNKRTVGGQPRTSNNIEGWHNGINYSVLHTGKYNHILKIIDGLKLEQQHTEHLITRLNTGSKEAKRKRAYVELDARINTMLSDYSLESLETFLANMSLVIAF